MQCEVEKKGRIFFPDFCKLCLRKFREFDEENFRQELFKVCCTQIWAVGGSLGGVCNNVELHCTVSLMSYLLISPQLDGSTS